MSHNFDLGPGYFFCYVDILEKYFLLLFTFYIIQN